MYREGQVRGATGPPTVLRSNVAEVRAIAVCLLCRQPWFVLPSTSLLSPPALTEQYYNHLSPRSIVRRAYFTSFYLDLPIFQRKNILLIPLAARLLSSTWSSCPTSTSLPASPSLSSLISTSTGSHPRVLTPSLSVIDQGRLTTEQSTTLRVVLKDSLPCPFELQIDGLC